MKKINIFITLSQKKWREILPAYGDSKDSRPDHHYNIMIINSIQTILGQNHPISPEIRLLCFVVLSFLSSNFVINSITLFICFSIPSKNDLLLPLHKSNSFLIGPFIFYDFGHKIAP